MTTTLIIGNIFSLLSALCIAISAVKQSKNDFMYWQVGDTLFGIFCNLVLSAYAALVISIVCLVRNFLSYKNKLTKNITYALLLISVIVGWWANNLGIIGWLAIIASAVYTICIYITKNEQQMRWALVLNQVLWFIHGVYIQAYPSAIACIVLTFWTLFQIYKNRKKY
ncbi:MAG: YgjV family protein [Alphaproteobacteria bacterium]|nr:YgjV family protein [Alphaproteobacteria bacterium]